MLEEGILENSVFRAELSKEGIAEVWISPGLDLIYRFDTGAGDSFNEMMSDLAVDSGYTELKYAPVIPIGHSAAASYPWNFAAWSPGRTLAIISVHGDAPLTNMTGSGRPNPDWGARNIDGVPGLMVMGEYEWVEGRLTPAMAYRKTHPLAPIAFLADASNSHFYTSDELINFLCLFIEKSAQYRLPKYAPIDSPVPLNPIDPRKGWLVDRWRFDGPPEQPAAPWSQYAGNRDEAFWCFDREMANAVETYYARQRGKQPQLVSFVQDGKLLPQTGGLAGVKIPFEPLSDGISFHLSADFVTTVSSTDQMRWTHQLLGTTVGHSLGPVPVKIRRICGPVIQTGPDTWSVRFYRMGLTNSKRTGDIWLIAMHPGDAKFKQVEQQGLLHIPLTNTAGQDQRITFPTIPDQKVGVNQIKLNAVSDANVPVYYYVKQGPAEVADDGTLTFTPIPPKSKLPVAVAIVAWQYGRSAAPKLKTAAPVEQTFYITK
jgi:hypothetical protein